MNATEAAEFYQISSKNGVRHKVPGPMPAGDAAGAMWQGRDLPLTTCTRRLRPVNFYEAGEPSNPRWQCEQCFPPAC